MDRKKFICRELSWLEFNSRVLDEAGNTSHPLLERLKFIAIFSNNLDEFFMVRVASLRQLHEAGLNHPDVSGLTPQEQILAINRKVNLLLRRQQRYLNDELLPALANEGIQVVHPPELDLRIRTVMQSIFLKQIFPVLTPCALDKSHPLPIFNSGAIQIAVSLVKDDDKELKRAFVEVPAVLPRFIQVPGKFSKFKQFVLLEELIIANIQFLFKGCKIIDTFAFRITRDMDFEIDEVGVADLMQHMKQALLQRKKREPIRLELLRGQRCRLEKWLSSHLDIAPELKYTVPWPLNPASFFELLPQISRPDLKNELWQPLALPESVLTPDSSMFDLIERNDCILDLLPFQSFDPVIKLLDEAADDPNVLAIKQTLYRVSGDSPVIGALQRAAENGKQVTVIVELKARFDENNNINWAKKLEESGAHVIYGIAGYKIHCKLLLVVKRAEDMTIKRYLHLSTGNYNDKTAMVYTDIGVFLREPGICNDVSSLFNVMTGYSAPFGEWNKIAVAPFNLRGKLIELIEREARLSTGAVKGRIIAKMNSLVDPEIIRSLFAAAKAGVKIDLIVRGICCLKPITSNIRVISIVDRFLEHSRVFYFHNCGDEEFYLSSADWMPRNFDHRIEILFPIENDSAKKMIRQLLDIQLDDANAHILQESGKYVSKRKKNCEQGSQYRTYQLLLKNLNKNRQAGQNEKKMKVFSGDV